ncbi:MAG: ABC transporter substrate-binding protein [SAR202 cluster bacterium]|jgi:4,5-dihydroxyphthalate decarboxylase|nr:ABC transporter substrate-binding protein [SAR202 cluster bacterium]MDP6513349.1 ABC transporter substrate-binding protein [SAR202 cluster bacterium]MDP6714267.1 ABC transporter substrate-binding protein [SAR202 cluster bacterium]
MPDTTLHTAFGSYGHTAALKDGTLNSRNFEFDHVEINPVTAIFRRMVRGLEFDVCEMAFSTYLCSRAHRQAFTALPIYLTRGFHQNAISYNTNSGIQSPADVEGKRVGVRGYTVTTGVWVRGILNSVYGVDLDKVTWVLSGDEHVAEYVAPSNVISSENSDLGAMLASGEIDAAIGAPPSDAPNIQPLITDARAAGIEYFQNTGIYPINHTVVVRDAILNANPWLAEELFEMFTAAKETYLKSIRSGGDSLNSADQALLDVAEIVGNDPLPYGVESGMPALEALIQFCVDQQVIPEKVDPEQVFAPSTLNL